MNETEVTEEPEEISGAQVLIRMPGSVKKKLVDFCRFHEIKYSNFVRQCFEFFIALGKTPAEYTISEDVTRSEIDLSPISRDLSEIKEQLEAIQITQNVLGKNLANYVDAILPQALDEALKRTNNFIEIQEEVLEHLAGEIMQEKWWITWQDYAREKIVEELSKEHIIKNGKVRRAE